MARRTTRQNTEGKKPEANEENTVSTETEAPQESTTESTDSTTESTEPAKAPVDLTAFKAAVAAAAEAADTSTGSVPEGPLSEVTVQYRALEGIKAKNQAKAFVNEAMKDAMSNDDLPGARTFMSITDKALVAQSGGKGGAGAATREPADPTANFVQRVATLNLAYNLATGNVPEKVSEDWKTKVDELVSESSDTAASFLTWINADPETRGDEPEVSGVVRSAAKLAVGKAAKAGVSRGGGSFTGERRDIGVHIQSAFESLNEGDFLKIAAIRNHRSDEYGDTPPSAGAISARLFPDSGKSSMVKVGIKPDIKDGKKGATKVAVPADDEE